MRHETLGGKAVSKQKQYLRNIIKKQQLSPMKPFDVTQGSGAGTSHAPRFTSDKNIEKFLLRAQRHNDQLQEHTASQSFKALQNIKINYLNKKAQFDTAQSNISLTANASVINDKL